MRERFHLFSKITLPVIVVISISFLSTSAQQLEGAIPAYENHSMMLVKPLTGEAETDFLRQGFDIVEMLSDGSYKVVATSADRERLRTEWSAEIEIENLEEYYRQRLDPDKAMGGYHTLEEVYSELVVATFDSLVMMDTIGYSLEDRPIVAVKISDNVEIDEDEPEIMFNGLIHAREPITMELILYLMHFLLDYRDLPNVWPLIANTEIWLVPVINPDGYYYNQLTNPDGGGMWRKNRRDNGDGEFGVDLNRNWGLAWGYNDVGSSPITSSETYRGVAPFSEPETQVMREFINAHEFPIILNYHSFGYFYSRMWGFNPQIYNPDETFIQYMLDSVWHYTGYNVGHGGGGYNGNAPDWQYGEQVEKKKVMAYLSEVGYDFWPDLRDIIPLCQENLQVNLYFIREAQQLWRRPTLWIGTTFINYDSTVQVCSEDFSFSIGFHNNDDDDPFEVSADFVRVYGPESWCTVDEFTSVIDPLGSFEIQVHISPSSVIGWPGDESNLYGYIRLVLSNFDDPSLVDTLWYPVHAAAETPLIQSDFEVSPLPAKPYQPVQFTNLSTGYDSCHWDFGDGYTSTETNPVHTYEIRDYYTVQLICWLGCAVDTARYVNYMIVEGCCDTPGDVNHDGGTNVSDLTSYVDYMFAGGEVPPCFEEGDIDGNCQQDVSDLTYFVDYLFGGGSPPAPCSQYCE